MRSGYVADGISSWSKTMKKLELQLRSLALLVSTAMAAPAPQDGCLNQAGSVVPCTGGRGWTLLDIQNLTAQLLSRDFTAFALGGTAITAAAVESENILEPVQPEMKPETENIEEGELDFSNLERKLDEGTSEYLKKFGYFKTDEGFNNKFETDLDIIQNGIKALKRFQLRNGLEPTGIMDEETKTLIEQPRCGFEDQFTDFENFELAGSRFEKKDLTYKISKYSEKISQQQLDQEVRKAFNMWEENSGLTFTKITSGTPDIEISFVRYGTAKIPIQSFTFALSRRKKSFKYTCSSYCRRKHGDPYPLDGSSNRGGTTLAHAFFPHTQYKGQAHFDEDESWSVTPNVGNQVSNQCI